MSRGAGPRAPDGYVRLDLEGGHAVALAAHADAIEAALRHGTLYEFAAAHPAARRLEGRLPTYAVPLADGARVVIRHSTHGGLLAPITGDRFPPPTRAPRELANARRLTSAGVATPEVVGYAVYRAGPFLRRADVVTREVADAVDFGHMARHVTSADQLPPPVRALLSSLQRAGAVHPDLNVKNILLAPAGAYVLDVDRVEFRAPGDPSVDAANVRRLMRSIRKVARASA